MIDDCSQVVEQRRTISSPTEIVIRKRSLMPTIPSKQLQELQGRCEYDGAMAPSAEPTIPPEHADLKIVSQGRPSAARIRTDPHVR